MLLYMDAHREQQLVDLLNKYDVSGVPFNQAKEKLLASGYTEAEIVYGLYSAPFDGKINTKRPANPLQKFYEQDPDRADKLAKDLLYTQAQMDWDKTASYAAASQFAYGKYAQNYELSLADRLGIPYFTILAINVVIAIVIIKFNISHEIGNVILTIFGLLVNTLFITKLIQERRRLNKLRKEAQKK